jgi:outer membrane protein assembly factor BamD
MSKRILLPLCGIALFLLGGCTTTQRRLSAKEYYTQASAAFEKEDFAAAVDHYRELLDQYPLNPYAEEAQLKVAYAYYLDKKYTEAIAAFGDFERAYPTSAHMPFVEYYRGMCHLEQFRSIDRDQSVVEKAYNFFREVTDRYPDSSFVPLAEEKIKTCRETMAEHELYIADFNHKNSTILATVARLRAIVENYPETNVTVGALARLQKVLADTGKSDLAELAAQALAARQMAKPAATPTTVAALEEETEAVNDLPSPGVDPLLLLVTELKKEETEARKLSAPPLKSDSEGKTPPAAQELSAGGPEE